MRDKFTVGKGYKLTNKLAAITITAITFCILNPRASALSQSDMCARFATGSDSRALCQYIYSDLSDPTKYDPSVGTLLANLQTSQPDFDWQFTQLLRTFIHRHVAGDAGARNGTDNPLLWSYDNNVPNQDQAAAWSYISEFDNNRHSVQCGGIAKALTKLAGMFGYTAYFHSMGAGPSGGHSDVLIWITHNGQKLLTHHDAYFNFSYGNPDGSPIDYLQLLRQLALRNPSAFKVVEGQGPRTKISTIYAPFSYSGSAKVNDVASANMFIGGLHLTPSCVAVSQPNCPSGQANCVCPSTNLLSTACTLDTNIVDIPPSACVLKLTYPLGSEGVPVALANVQTWFHDQGFPGNPPDPKYIGLFTNEIGCFSDPNPEIDTCHTGNNVPDQTTIFNNAVQTIRLAVTPSSQIVPQGATAYYKVLLGEKLVGAGTSFSATGLPPGVSPTFDFVTGSSAVMTVPTTTATPVGSYTITITATGGGQTGTASVTMTIGNNRIGFLDTTANPWVKEGALTAPWVQEFYNDVQLAFTSTRIGVVDNLGNFYVKEPGLYDSWIQEDTNVAQIALSNDRIGEVLTNGTVKVKEGSLGAPWVVQQASGTGATRVVLSPLRVAVLFSNGNYEVKEGSLSGPWTLTGSNVTQIALTDTRVGILDTSRNYSVKEPDLSSSWTLENSNVAQIALSGPRIGFVGTDGSAQVKEGSLGAPWVVEFYGVSQLALNGTRIGVLVSDGSGTFYVKENSLYDPWTQENSGATTISLGN